MRPPNSQWLMRAASAAAAMLCLAWPATAQAGYAAQGPTASEEVAAQSSAPLNSLPQATAARKRIIIRPRHKPNVGVAPNHGDDRAGRAGQAALAARSFAARRLPTGTPAPDLNFSGQSNNCSCSPPDTNGDAGPNHYVQIVNATDIAVYDKSGNLLAGYPKAMNSLWAGHPGRCDASANGDPVALYDPLADRWLLAQFNELQPSQEGICVAVSKTGDPTGAYWLYDFKTPELPDYFKFGVWSNAYYMADNESAYSAYAFDRSKMLAGQAAKFIRFTGQNNLLLPADIDGKAKPPKGSPGLFYTFKDDTIHGGSDRLELFSFKPNFATPSLSKFTLINSINVTPFVYTVCGFFIIDCIPQASTATKVDAVSEWPMHRLVYRNFGSYQGLAGNFTVESATADAAAIRWFELRNSGSGWSLFQEGTQDSNDGTSRFMGSIAFDAGGDLALGYSVSSAAMFPAIAYAVHRIGDALGTMQPEQTLVAGGGAQTGSNRWGDYSAMAIDPADDKTFWYTQEYYTASSFTNWATRIGTFRILQPQSVTSTAANDGYVTETSENSNLGGAVSATATTIRVGDDKSNRQIRGFVDFDTSAIPDDAVVAGATLWLKRTSVTGSPGSLGKLLIDIRGGDFGTATALEPGDFQAAADDDAVPGLAASADTPGWYKLALPPDALGEINVGGHTQMRIRFTKDDDNDHVADFFSFASGEAVTGQPRLDVSYYIP